MVVEAALAGELQPDIGLDTTEKRLASTPGIDPGVLIFPMGAHPRYFKSSTMSQLFMEGASVEHNMSRRLAGRRQQMRIPERRDRAGTLIVARQCGLMRPGLWTGALSAYMEE